MRTLFVVSGKQKTATVFSLAKKMVERGHVIAFLLVGEGCRSASDLQDIGVPDFAESINVLNVGREGRSHDLPVGIKMLDYEGCVDLMEMCDRIVSWT